MRQLLSHGVAKERINIPIKISLAFGFKDKRHRDLTNLAESVMDLLVDYGTIADDRWQIVRSVHMRGYESDRDDVEITIEPYRRERL